MTASATYTRRRQSFWALIRTRYELAEPAAGSAAILYFWSVVLVGVPIRLNLSEGVQANHCLLLARGS
eukprot:COSAG01_NODE_1607_length_9744_cov_26.629031_8_plen_68_part_00